MDFNSNLPDVIAANNGTEYKLIFRLEFVNRISLSKNTFTQIRS